MFEEFPAGHDVEPPVRPDQQMAQWCDVAGFQQRDVAQVEYRRPWGLRLIARIGHAPPPRFERGIPTWIRTRQWGLSALCWTPARSLGYGRAVGFFGRAGELSGQRRRRDRGSCTS